MPLPKKTASVKLMDTSISYFESGDGITLFCLHGNPGNKADFNNLSDILIDGKKFRMVAVDRPGHGNSEEILKEPLTPWSDALIYSEMITKLCKGKTYLIGYSLGCFAALKIAIKYPQMVSGLGLISPFVMPRDPGEKPSSIPGLAQNAFLGTILGILVPLFASGKMKKHLEDVFFPLTCPGGTVDDNLRRFTKFDTLLAVMNDKNDMLKIMEEVHRDMSKIACPTLLLAGSKDAICDSKAQVEKIAAAIKGAEKVFIEDGGHGLPFTHVTKLAEHLRAHLEKIK